MKKNKIVAGIDIGSSKIATIIAQIASDPNSLEGIVSILGANSVQSKGVKKGQIVDIEAAVEATIASVEAAERMAGYNLDSAYVSLGGAHIASQNSHGVVAISDPDSEVSIEDIDRVIEAARAVSLPSSREIIHVIPKEFVVDGETGVKDPVGMSGVRLEVETHIVTASVSALKNLTKTVNEVGVEIVEMVFSGLAASESTVSPTEKELGAVLVDIGGGTTSIAAFIDGGLAYSGVIPIGAKNVTNDLAIGLRISLEGAEKIKIALSQKDNPKENPDFVDITEFGVSESKKISKKTLTEGIIRPRLNEIFTMVRMELERTGIANRVPSGAIITGGGALTVGVTDAARRMMSLPVRIGKPSGVKGLVDDILSPPFSIAIGLVLFGSKNNVSIPVSFTKKFKLPSRGLLTKIVESIRNLLP